MECEQTPDGEWSEPGRFDDYESMERKKRQAPREEGDHLSPSPPPPDATGRHPRPPSHGGDWDGSDDWEHSDDWESSEDWESSMSDDTESDDAGSFVEDFLDALAGYDSSDDGRSSDHMEWTDTDEWTDNMDGNHDEEVRPPPPHHSNGQRPPPRGDMPPPPEGDASGPAFPCGTVGVEYIDEEGNPRPSVLHQNVDQEDMFPEVRKPVCRQLATSQQFYKVFNFQEIH